MHYIRDEAFGEDRCPIYRGDAPQNLAALHNAGLNWLRHEKPTTSPPPCAASRGIPYDSYANSATRTKR